MLLNRYYTLYTLQNRRTKRNSIQLIIVWNAEMLCHPTKKGTIYAGIAAIKSNMLVFFLTKFHLFGEHKNFVRYSTEKKNIDISSIIFEALSATGRNCNFRGEFRTIVANELPAAAKDTYSYTYKINNILRMETRGYKDLFNV